MKITAKSRSVVLSSLITAGVATFVFAASAATAQAAEPSQTLTKTVTYGDLNLDNAAGARALYARLQQAAKQVCSPAESKELSRQQGWKQCVRDALASAVVQINKPAVTALHSRSVNPSSTG